MYLITGAQAAQYALGLGPFKMIDNYSIRFIVICNVFEYVIKTS